MVVKFADPLQMRPVEFKFQTYVLLSLSLFAASLRPVQYEWSELVVSAHTLRLSSLFARSEDIVSCELVFVHLARLKGLVYIIPIG